MAAEPALYDDVERLTIPEYGSRVEAAVLDQVTYTYRNSPFYRETLETTDIDPEELADLEDVRALPFTEKDTLRERQESQPPFGDYRACESSAIARVYTSSGTTGRPTFIGLTEADLQGWIGNSARAAYAAGLRPDDTIVGAVAGGPFVAAISYDGYQQLGATTAPVGPGQTDRIITMFQNDCGTALACTPSYIEYFLEEVRDRGIEPGSLGLERVLVGGEPGVETLRDPVETAFGCSLTESMGNGDMAISIWGECDRQNGMHFTGHGSVYPELIDPEDGTPVEWSEGAVGELVYTSLRRECMPVLRFRTHDHIEVVETNCGCGRGSVCIRGRGRTDNMFVVRGVNVYPPAVKDLVASMAGTTGHLRIHLESSEDHSVPAPVPVTVEATPDASADLAERVETRIRDDLQFRADVTVVPEGTLERSEYKSAIITYD